MFLSACTGPDARWAGWNVLPSATPPGRPAAARAALSGTAPTPIEIVARPQRAGPPPASAAVEEKDAPPPVAPSPVAPSPPMLAPVAPPAAPVPARWPIRAGSTLRDTLEAWASGAPCAAGPRPWTVVWKSRRIHAIEASHELEQALDFAAAADRLLGLYARHASPPVDWSVWTGNCAIVVTDRPDGEGNEPQ